MHEYDPDLKARIAGITIGILLVVAIPLLEMCMLRPDFFALSQWSSNWPVVLMIVGVMAPVFGMMGGAIAASLYHRRNKD